jgi:molybdate transport repressor ModE-like protein
MTVLSELWNTTRMGLLVEIDRRGSLSAAAQAVGIGQPSASQHLRTLEAAAGQRLVERNGRGSRLTE